MLLRPFLLNSCLCFSLLFFIGCGQTFNSNTEDFNLLASSFCTDQSNTALCTANEIIQTKCTTCHTSNIHAFWSGLDTNAEWVASGRVVAGNPDASNLVTKLKNYGGNMPDQAPELSDADAQAIRDWISGI
jgi:hypothetical protein